MAAQGEIEIEEGLFLLIHCLQQTVKCILVVSTPFVAHLITAEVVFGHHIVEPSLIDQSVEVIETDVATIDKCLTLIAICPKFLCYKWQFLSLLRILNNAQSWQTGMTAHYGQEPLTTSVRRGKEVVEIDSSMPQRVNRGRGIVATQILNAMSRETLQQNDHNVWL